MLTFLYFIVAVICNIVSVYSGFSISSLQTVGYCSIFILLSYSYIDYKLNKRFSFSSLFVIILFLFHFGQLMIYSFFSDIYDHVRFLLLLKDSDSLYGFRIMTISLSALCLGILWKSACLKNKSLKLTQTANIDWIKLSKRIIYATFFVKFGLDLATLVLSFTAGGVAARHFVNSFPNVLLFYGKISMLGFALLLVALKKQPQKQYILFVSIIGYILIMMVSGIRSENVGYLAVFVFIYLQSRTVPIKFRQIILYAFLGFWGLTFIVAVGQFRLYTEKNLNTFLELIDHLVTKENVILGLFDTCGDTGYTAHETIHAYLPKFGPTYGDAYYKGITAIIPNLMPSIVDIGAITEESSTPIKLQKSGVLNSSYENIGGSFLAELYMNFGIVGGIIMCFAFGIFFGWVGRVSSIAFITNNNYQLIIMIPIMLASIYWVRSYFGGGVREAVWDILMGLFFYKKMVLAKH